MNPTSCHLPNSHIFMLWGVEPIWSLERQDHAIETVYSQHLLDFLYNLNFCTPLVSGFTLLPSIIPDQLPPTHQPTLSPSLRSRRVYFFSFLPVRFFSQFVARVVSSFLKTTGGLPPPISPGEVPPSGLSIPFEMQSGLLLYVWRNHIFVKDQHGSQLLLKV